MSYNRETGGVTIWQILGCFGIVVVVVAAILFPVLARSPCGGETNSCISNLNQIGKAMKSYMADWEDTYPTNRARRGQTVDRSYIAVDIPLSDFDPNIDYRFKYGINWVEALYPYIEKVGDKNDNASVWKCARATMAPHAGDGTGGMGRGSDNKDTASNTYCMNYNLLEQQEETLQVPGNTMLLREMDRLFGAVTRGKPGPHGRPMYPFLSENDPDTPGARPLHQQGSNILFADGHAKTVSKNLMPDTCVQSTRKGKPTGQWWNFNPETQPEKGIIAITP